MTGRVVLLLLLSFFCPWGRAHGQPVTGSPSLQQLLSAKLKERVAEVDRRFDGVLGLCIIDLTSGEELRWNAEQIFPAASTIKTAILAELLRQRRLDETYVPRREDAIAGSPILAGLRFGSTRLTYQDLATFMIVVSDNGATNVLLDRLGLGAVNATLDRLGLRETRLRRRMLDGAAVRAGQENTTTARELAGLYARLHGGQVLDEAARQLLFHILSLSPEGPLVARLPEGLRVSHKLGSLDGMRGDAGIVFVPGRPFAIAALTTYAADGRLAEEAIAEIGDLAYRHFARLADSTAYGRKLP